MGNGGGRQVNDLAEVVRYGNGHGAGMTVVRRGDWTPVARQRGIKQICAAFLDAVGSGNLLSAEDALATPSASRSSPKPTAERREPGQQAPAAPAHLRRLRRSSTDDEHPCTLADPQDLPHAERAHHSREHNWLTRKVEVVPVPVEVEVAVPA